MTDPAQAPATKQDIAILMETLGQLMGKMTGMEDRLTGVEGRMTGMEERIEQLDQKIDGVEHRLLVRFENLRHDVLGALKDVGSNDRQVADHEERIVRLERATGLARA